MNKPSELCQSPSGQSLFHTFTDAVSRANWGDLGTAHVYQKARLGLTEEVKPVRSLTYSHGLRKRTAP